MRFRGRLRSIEANATSSKRHLAFYGGGEIHLCLIRWIYEQWWNTCCEQVVTMWWACKMSPKLRHLQLPNGWKMSEITCCGFFPMVLPPQVSARRQHSWSCKYVIPLETADGFDHHMFAGRHTKFPWPPSDHFSCHCTMMSPLCAVLSHILWYLAPLANVLQRNRRWISKLWPPQEAKGGVWKNSSENRHFYIAIARPRTPNSEHSFGLNNNILQNLGIWSTSN